MPVLYFSIIGLQFFPVFPVYLVLTNIALQGFYNFFPYDPVNFKLGWLFWNFQHLLFLN